MKLKGKLKIVLIILIVVMISIIGFVGIYVQDGSKMNNVLPKYMFGMELEGYRRIELKISETENEENNEEEVKDEDSNETIKIEENYKKVKEIIKQRLDKLNVQEYYIRQGQDSETIIIQIPEDDRTDSIVAQLQMQGKFEIVDHETDEVLMTNDDIQEVKAGYGTTSSGTGVFLSIQFNKEGKEKFKDITNTYIEVTEDKTENIEENEEKVANVEENEEVNTDTETTKKEIAIKIDNSELLTTYFSEEVSNGLLQLSVGSSNNNSAEELKEYYDQANNIAALLNSGNIPIKYEVNQNKYVQSDITNKDIAVISSIGIALLTILIIVAIIKNKEKAILASISLIGYIALLTILLRYTNVIISIEGLVGIVASAILEYVFLLTIIKSKQEDFWKIYAKYIWILLPILVIAVTFALTTGTLAISSFGMVIFWGIVTKFLWNSVITKNILDFK